MRLFMPSAIWRRIRKNNDNICMQIDDNADSWLTCIAFCNLIKFKQHGMILKSTTHLSEYLYVNLYWYGIVAYNACRISMKSKRYCIL